MMKYQEGIKFSSWVFHPLWLPVISFFLIIQSGHYLQFLDSTIVKAIFLIIFSSSFLLPALIIPLLYYLNLFPNLHFREIKNRQTAIFIVLVIYSLSLLMMLKSGFPEIIIKILIVYIADLFLVLLLLPIFNINVHTTAWSSLLGLVIYLSINYGLDLRNMLIIIVLLNGIIASFQIRIAYHKISEIYSGVLIGALMMFLGLTFL
jgi:hypothetical protein